eukprot:370542-Rhodomonas_salina.4
MVANGVGHRRHLAHGTQLPQLHVAVDKPRTSQRGRGRMREESGAARHCPVTPQRARERNALVGWGG